MNRRGDVAVPQMMNRSAAVMQILNCEELFFDVSGG
jgi:hypothetical protein